MRERPGKPDARGKSNHTQGRETRPRGAGPGIAARDGGNPNTRGATAPLVTPRQVNSYEPDVAFALIGGLVIAMIVLLYLALSKGSGEASTASTRWSGGTCGRTPPPTCC